jgi:hypothetical protein
MTLRVLLLVGSAALNAALLAAFLAKPALVPPPLRTYLQRDSAGAGAAAAAPSPPKEMAIAGPSAQPTTASDLWSALHSADLATLVSRLRAAGFPASIVRAIIDAEIERQFSPRIKELLRSMNETPFWKPDPSYFSGNAKVFEEVSQIYRERSRVLRDLLGKDAYAWAGTDATTAQRRQFGNISPAKIDLVQRINDDYAEMMGQVRAAMQGVTLPEDREKLALLEREKRLDLAAVLTAEELADYEMRTSSVTSRLRTAFTIMDASEAEFLALYKIHEPFKDILYPNYSVGFGSAESSEKRRDATKQINDQVKALLGEARYAQYQRATDSEFQQLYRLAQRDNVPYDTLVRAYDLRNPTAHASIAILENTALSLDAKRAALKELAQSVRTQLLSTLGPSAGPAYVESSRWLSYLDRGYGITITPEGGISMRPPMAPRPAPAPGR